MTGDPRVLGVVLHVPGAEVIRRAQARLNGYGFEAGEPDGGVGPVTRKALREFQSLNGLGESGRVDVATPKRLGVEP